MRQSLKCNRRSFRYTDEADLILAEYRYDLDALVLDAYYRLPELKEQIALEQTILREVQAEALRVRSDIQEIQTIGQLLSSMMTELVPISRRLDDLATGRITRK